MNDDSQPPAPQVDSAENAAPTLGSEPALPVGGGFFRLTDWLTCAFTSLASLAVYLSTLAPQVTLGASGIFSTGAFYGGVSHPPGYPLWTLYAWFFTEALPFSNIAWRVAVSSAFAGALTCGLLALMVSRGGALMLEGIAGFKRLPMQEEKWLCGASGYAAGMAFGLCDPFWGKAVIADVWALTMLLLCVVLCLLFRWFYAPQRRSYFIAACFVYGLTLTNSQALALAAPGLALITVSGKPALGRDGLFAISLLLALSVVADRFGAFPWILAGVTQTDLFGRNYIGGGILALLVSVALGIKTRKLFTEWKTVLASGCALGLGLSLYFCLPIASMTNPPMNWGYARTVTGFVHDLRRGQFERIRPTDSVARFAEQAGGYTKMACKGFGLIYLAPALVPFCFLRRMRGPDCRWLFGCAAVYFCLSLLVLFFLNPTLDKGSLEINSPFFSVSYLLLALWAGNGLTLTGSFLARRA